MQPFGAELTDFGARAVTTSAVFVEGAGPLLSRSLAVGARYGSIVRLATSTRG